MVINIELSKKNYIYTMFQFFNSNRSLKKFPNFEDEENVEVPKKIVSLQNNHFNSFSFEIRKRRLN